MQILGQTMYQTGYQKAPISALNLESSFCYKSNCNWLVVAQETMPSKMKAQEMLKIRDNQNNNATKDI